MHFSIFIFRFGCECWANFLFTNLSPLISLLSYVIFSINCSLNLNTQAHSFVHRFNRLWFSRKSTRIIIYCHFPKPYCSRIENHIASVMYALNWRSLYCVRAGCAFSLKHTSWIQIRLYSNFNIDLYIYSTLTIFDNIFNLFWFTNRKQ